MDDEYFIITIGDGRSYLYDNHRRVKTAIQIKLFDSPCELTEPEWKYGFSSKLKKRIKETGITQYELADRLGIATSMIDHYINGGSVPSSYILNKMAAVLCCDTSDLLPSRYIPIR